MAKGCKPTIRDVAREAGVSTATVSYVLNGKVDVNVSDPVRARVREAVRRLNYHRAAAAVSLATQRSGNIGLILSPVHSDITNPFYSFVIHGVIREVTERKYNVLFSYVESSRGRPGSVPQMIRESNAEGILFVGRIDRAQGLQMVQLGMPVVAIDPGLAIEGVPSVRIDDHGGGELAARHLLDLGHRRMAFVGLVPGLLSIEDREKGFRSPLADAGPAVTLGVVQFDALTYEESHVRVRRLLASCPEITALFAGNDEVAAGAMRAAREQGRAVPNDLSVVGFDDIIMAQYTDPPLTTVAVPKESLGRTAARLLIDIIDGVGNARRDEIVPVKLVIRDSTAPPCASKVSPKRGPA